MLEAYGDIWDLADSLKAGAVVITTNGFVKQNSEAVMGRGIALEAATRYPKLAMRLGLAIEETGNKVYAFIHYRASKYQAFVEGWWPEIDRIIISFPVKPRVGPNGEPGWLMKADLKLIETSAQQLKDLINVLPIDVVVLPRPGCGNGRLKWEQVKPIIEPYLDDRFVVCHKPA